MEPLASGRSRRYPVAMPHLYLVDGSGYIFRAYHVLPKLTNRHGEPAGAVYGYTTMLWKLANELHKADGPTHLAVVLDKSRIAGQQSTRAWGFVRQQGRDPSEMPLAIASNRLWLDLQEELRTDLGWRQGGCLYIGHDDAQMARYETCLETSRQHGIDTRPGIGFRQTGSRGDQLRQVGLVFG